MFLCPIVLKELEQTDTHTDRIVLERERSSFLNPILSASTQVAGFTSYPSIARKHHHATLLCQWHPPFSVQSDWYAFPLSLPRHIWSPTTSSFRHFKF